MVYLSAKSKLLLAKECGSEISSMREFAIMNDIDWDWVVSNIDPTSADSSTAYAESLVTEAARNEKSFLEFLDYIGAKENSSFMSKVNKDLAEIDLQAIMNDDGVWELVEKSDIENKTKYENPVEPVKKENHASVAKQDSNESNTKQINHKSVENIYEGKIPSIQSNDIEKIIISSIDSKLRKAIRDKPEKEKAIQDVLENLFIGADLDKEFTREKENVEYCGKGYIPDFVFKKISMVVEAKLCNSTKREKEIIDEINADIAAYKTKYVNLIFVVYDLGIIRDSDKMKEHLEKNKNVTIKIVKH